MARTKEFTARVSISLSPSQLALAKVAARQVGLPLAIWLRRAVLTAPDFKAVAEEQNRLKRDGD